MIAGKRSKTLGRINIRKLALGISLSNNRKYNRGKKKIPEQRRRKKGLTKNKNSI